MRNIALYLTYLGTAYHGWQVQKNLPTVAETMEKAAAMVVGHPVHMTGCGRTDAGVHARMYVANFRTSSTIPVERLPYALNTHLPCDIVVTKAFEVHDDFNAIGSHTADCSKIVGADKLIRSFLHDLFIQMRRIKPGTVHIERILQSGIVDLISILLPGAGTDGIEIFMDFKSLGNHNIRRKMGIQSVGQPVTGNGGSGAEIGNVHPCMDTGIGTSAAGDMNFVTHDHFRGFFHGFSNGGQILLYLPSVIGRSQIS